MEQILAALITLVFVIVGSAALSWYLIDYAPDHFEDRRFLPRGFTRTHICRVCGWDVVPHTPVYVFTRRGMPATYEHPTQRGYCLRVPIVTAYTGSGPDVW